ncbi:probable transmembrane regulatory nosR transcription regulator protein [Thiobacillus denitrificans ATCC 25259]|uniref:Probable transmembrane regulatory nosR transcription regulator protein n=1 Tax=Thiobacillus denitrificans (strain ATCC 25259 / T1) TaxID=292415 RepID=Q3SJ27_THIDA|nr:4Fe-4S binding protein [Thiobacillus denitrificans]AAZ97343.1 probable transmembrane regulatory nosR transcription regulator protein [Thiobacillus denitrificans ATCC 25259]
MKYFSAFASRLFASVLLCCASGLATAAESGATYEAPLPVQLSTDPDLCAYVPCKDVIPGADSFSKRMGKPAYVEAYANTSDSDDAPETDGAKASADENGRKLIGYVFLSTDIVDIPAYSGKPVVTLIGMDTKGTITGVRVLRHSEPILLLGIPESELTKFIKQYVGKFVGSKIEVGAGRPDQGVLGLDAITGATVTVIAQNQVVLRSGVQIAKQVGIIKPTIRPQAKFKQAEGNRDWNTLVDEGSVEHLRVETADVGMPRSREPYIDMYFGYLNAPGVGRSILGDAVYEGLMSRLKPGEHAIFVVANGIESFKGSGFVRGGIYDRVQVAQDMDTFTFRDLDYLNLYAIRADGAPSFRESAIFIVRSPTFSAAYPWHLVFLGNKMDPQTGVRTFANFNQKYWLPARHLEGGRPEIVEPEATWVTVWKTRKTEVILFVLWLAAAGTVYALRDKLVRRATYKDRRWKDVPKLLLWLTSIGFVGFYLLAVPSITQVLTWFHAILFEWRWELFLSDPFIFLFWIFIIVTVFFWGRGMFCGWMCPYGSLSEIVYKLSGKLGLKRFQRHLLPQRWHDRLKWVKYGVFAVLLAVSFYSMGMAEKMAEVEPFKTTFLVGVWNRTWPFVTFWLLLLLASMFFERPFCKYLCPLGAALAVPSTFRWWGLKRKKECGPCAACAVGCGSQAIDPSGRIDQRECLLCLDCQVLYYDDHACPPLAQERKRRTKAGEPLTPIGANGYFIPITPAAATVAPAAAVRQSAPAWIGQEVFDHLFPWSRKVFQQPILLQATTFALTILVTWVWVLGAAGRIGPGIVLGWWSAWSVYELVVRMRCKPYVKDGPWWGRNLRPASWADMAAYVTFKNLLIAATLFLIMKGTGVLDYLSDVPGLEWLY